MKILTYNPAALVYEILLSLNQRKGRIIEDINTIQIHLGTEPIDFEQLLVTIYRALGSPAIKNQSLQT